MDYDLVERIVLTADKVGASDRPAAERLLQLAASWADPAATPTAIAAAMAELRSVPDITASNVRSAGPDQADRDQAEQHLIDRDPARLRELQRLIDEQRQSLGRGDGG